MPKVLLLLTRDTLYVSKLAFLHVTHCLRWKLIGHRGGRDEEGRGLGKVREEGRAGAEKIKIN